MLDLCKIVFRLFNMNLRCYATIMNRLICFDKMPIYSKDVKLKLEKYWMNKIYTQNQNEKLQKKYILSMFPYPSGQLHMGHMRVYTTADVLARYNRLINKSVIFPMGWDSFGLPAENAAFERGYEPQKWINKNISEMKEQMNEQMSLSINWNHEILTSDPKYYKWTQWLFCRLFENGLAYQRSAVVNWDPVDRTVLADELIDKEGRSWRSGSIVEKIPLKQWFLRSTAFSKDLLKGLDSIKCGQWRNVIAAQQGWLGNLEGIYIELDLLDYQDKHKVLDRLSVFTTKPVAVLTDLTAFVEINKDNIWWNYRSDSSRSQMVTTVSIHPHLVVRHPLSNRLIPILKNSDLKFKEEECLSARFGFPLLNLDDARLTGKLNISGSSVRLGAYNLIKGSAWSLTENQHLDINFESIFYDSCLKTLRSLNRGGYECSKLRNDWLISRQRYWGTPIPIVHCPSCGPVLVKDSDLPVELPPFNDCKSNTPLPIGSSPLGRASDWINVNCPKCGNAESKRETDTMDTFVDSSWYFLRYLDPSNETHLCSPKVAFENMSVDLYVGGLEHTIRHLFYARFMSYFIHHYTDIKLPQGPEPFLQFLPIGLVLAPTYQTKLGQYVQASKVKYRDYKPFHIETGEQLSEDWDKMSKSKHNGISPKSVVDKYGLDSTRLIMLSNTGPDKNRKWQENDVVVGVQAWEKKLWNIIERAVESNNQDINKFLLDDCLLNNVEFTNQYRSTMKTISFHYSKTFTISVVISYLQKFTRLLSKQSINLETKHSVLYYRSLLQFLLYLYPLSPLLASELWAQLTLFLLPFESAFIQTNSKYFELLGEWNFDLNLPIYEQRLIEEKENFSLQSSNSINVVN